MEEYSILPPSIIHRISIPLRHTPLAIAILLTAYVTVLVVGLVGNVLVIAVVVKLPKIKTATKYFVTNLAIADLLVLLFCLLPSLISNIYVPWVLGSFLCKAVPYVQGVSVCASVYSLAAISADRFMAVRCPFSRQVTQSVARRIILLIWIWATGLALPWLLYFDLSNADGREPSMVFCIESWPAGMNGNTYFVLVNLGFCYICPLTFISVCHVSIWLRVRRRQQVATSAPVSQRQLVNRRADDSLQKQLIAVVIGFAVCWLPLYLIFVRVKLIPAVLGGTEEKLLDYALPIAQWLGAATSCINPILFAVFNQSFRLTLQDFVRGSLAHVTPRSRPSPHHNNNRPHQGAGLGPNLVRLSVALHHIHEKNSEPKNFRHNATDSGESDVVKFHQENLELAAITHYQNNEERPREIHGGVCSDQVSSCRIEKAWHN